MVIFTDPTRDNQVMALYSHDSMSRVWADLGYDRHQVDDHPEVMRLGRDCYVEFGPSGVIARVIARANTIRPEG